MLIRYGTDSRGNPVKKAVIYTKSEHHISHKLIDSDAIFVVNKLKENGYEAFIVGGAVRDLIIGRHPKDFDIVTDATPTKIKKIFRNSRIIGKRFRLVHIYFGSKIFETSTFRSIIDGSVGNAFGTMDEDVLRRDFSINALYYDPLKEQIIDYVNGVEDIKKGVIKPIIPLNRIFVEDSVRMIRAVKYSATTKCKLSYCLKKKIRQSAHFLTPVSPSRLTEEFLKILNSACAYDIVSLSLDCHIYEYIQPSATNLIIENKKFAKSYLENLRALDNFVIKNPDCRLGDKLYFILKDFVNSLTDWKKEDKIEINAAVLYRTTWNRCRNFILPMNPQRTELDYAVRKILIDFGVKLKNKKTKKSFEKK